MGCSLTGEFEFLLQHCGEYPSVCLSQNVLCGLAGDWAVPGRRPCRQALSAAPGCRPCLKNQDDGKTQLDHKDKSDSLSLYRSLSLPEQRLNCRGYLHKADPVRACNANSPLTPDLRVIHLLDTSISFQSEPCLPHRQSQNRMAIHPRHQRMTQSPSPSPN
jgi:hypothetical protein